VFGGPRIYAYRAASARFVRESRSLIPGNNAELCIGAICEFQLRQGQDICEISEVFTVRTGTKIKRKGKKGMASSESWRCKTPHR